MVTRMETPTLLTGKSGCMGILPQTMGEQKTFLCKAGINHYGLHNYLFRTLRPTQPGEWTMTTTQPRLYKDTWKGPFEFEQFARDRCSHS